ncbi:hypothetical protein OG410_41000 [Streptomyces sp. NBC_00659]|uniref:hypothetical protein n=1 Tax=Streptomyces sp. NBC_00659 TaxID=2903669 RepID=UPI002E37FB0A|nr:hypothetical protein [Streptomyces sp. NBC_00659]
MAAHPGRDNQTCGTQPVGDQSRCAPLVAGKLWMAVDFAAQLDQLFVDPGRDLTDRLTVQR